MMESTHLWQMKALRWSAYDFKNTRRVGGYALHDREQREGARPGQHGHRGVVHAHARHDARGAHACEQRAWQLRVRATRRKDRRTSARVLPSELAPTHAECMKALRAVSRSGLIPLNQNSGCSRECRPPPRPAPRPRVPGSRAERAP